MWFQLDLQTAILWRVHSGHSTVLQSLRASRKLKRIMGNQEEVNLAHHKQVDHPRDHPPGSRQEDPVREEEAEKARQEATIAQSLVALRQSLAPKKVPEMTEGKVRDIELKKRKRKEEEERTEEEEMKETKAVEERRKKKIVKMANVSTTMILVKVVKS